MGYTFYTDEELLMATGLHIDNVRKLVTWGAVKPSRGGKGRGNVRMWEASTVRHIASVTALVNAGLSLKVAHTLVYLDVLGDLFMDFIDPDTLAMNAGDKFGWFDPKKPLNPVEKHDFRIVIADGRYVYLQAITKDKPLPKGLLDAGGSVFRTNIDFARYSTSVGEDGVETEARPKWEIAPGHFDIDPKSLAWEYDKSLENDDNIDWQAAYRAAVSITTVNLSLACKIAMRRLLGIPVYFAK